MTTRMKCENPEKIEYTIVMTATAEEWEKLRDGMSERWPSYTLTSQINKLLGDARKIYWGKDEPK